MRKNKEMLIVKFAISSLLGIVLLMPVLAEAAGEKTGRLEEMVVTATRTEERIKDVPASVTVITRQDIERSPARSVQELVLATPGVYMYDLTGSGIEGHVSMRGFNPQGSKRVRIMVDGVPMNSGYDGYAQWAKMPDLADVERVEIVRGPSSALYGPFASGGVINIITRRARKKLEARGSGGGGSDGEWYTSAGVSGRAGRFDYRLSGGHRQGDGWRDHSRFKRSTFNSRLGLAVTPTIDLGLGFDYQKSDVQYPGYLTLTEYEQDPKQSVRPSEGDLESWRVSLDYLQELWSRQTLKALAYATYYDYDYPGSTYTYRGVLNGLGAELQYQFPMKLGDISNTLVAGADVRHERVDYQSLYRTSLSTDASAKPVFWGLFIQDEIVPLRWLRISAALRYDFAHYDYHDNLNDGDDGASFGELCPKVGLVVKAIEPLELYANVSRAFNPPSVYNMFISRYANPDLTPEVSLSYEVGLRGDALDRLSYSLTGYIMDVSDEVVLGAAGKYENTGQTRHQGLELALDLNLTAWLSLAFSGTLQDVKFTDYTSSAGDFEGKKVPYAPEQIFNARVDLHYAGFTLQVGPTYLGRRYSDVANTHEIPGQTVWNAKASYTYKTVNVFVRVLNLSDETYYQHMSSSGKVYPSPGRTFLVGVSARF